MLQIVLLRVLFFVILLLLPYGIEQFCYWKFTTRNIEMERYPPAKTIRGYGWAYLWDITHLAVLVAAGYRIIAPDQLFPTWEWIGCAIFWMGIALRIWALRELGPFYASGLVIKEDHRVVSTGPYRYIRHPLHLGTLTQIVGLAFFSPLWLAAPVVGVALALTLYHSHSEDLALVRHLGAAYQDYYVETWDPVDLIFWKRAISSDDRGVEG